MDARAFWSFRSYAVSVVVMVVMVPLTTIPMQWLIRRLLEDAIYFGDLGRPMPIYERYACSVFLAPIDVLNYFLLERVRPSFGNDDSLILIFWTKLIGLFWAVVVALPVAATGAHIARNAN